MQKPATTMCATDVDAHEWVKSLRLEYYRVATLRELRVGETFWIGFFTGPGVTSDAKGHCECYIERTRGGYLFHATWTIMWGRFNRPHIMTSGKFQLLPGNIIRLSPCCVEPSMRAFKLVCRYVRYFNRNAKRFGVYPIFQDHQHVLWCSTTVQKDGFTKYGHKGPVPRGLGAIVDVAEALGVFDDDQPGVTI